MNTYIYFICIVFSDNELVYFTSKINYVVSFTAIIIIHSYTFFRRKYLQPLLTVMCLCNYMYMLIMYVRSCISLCQKIIVYCLYCLLSLLSIVIKFILVTLIHTLTSLNDFEKKSLLKTM